MEDFIGIIVAIVISVVATVLEKKWPTWKKLFSSEDSRRETSHHAGASDAEESSPFTKSSGLSDHSLGSTYVPLEEYMELTETGVAEEVMPGDVTEPQFASSEPVGSADDAESTRREALSRHYARWRQAIFDSLIIPPKYND